MRKSKLQMYLAKGSEIARGICSFGVFLVENPKSNRKPEIPRAGEKRGCIERCADDYYRYLQKTSDTNEGIVGPRRHRRDKSRENNDARLALWTNERGLDWCSARLARNTGRNRNGNLLMRDMYHFSDRRGGRRSSLLNGSSCNLGMLNRLRDPMYRESGGKSQYSHDTEETLVRLSDPQRRWISNREHGFGLYLFFFFPLPRGF